MQTENDDVTNNLWMTVFHWAKVRRILLRDKGWYRIFIMIPYKVIECCQETNSVCTNAFLLNHCQLQSWHLKVFLINVFHTKKTICWNYGINLKIILTNKELPLRVLVYCKQARVINSVINSQCLFFMEVWTM